MKVSKPKSKRVPVRLRHKIQKASAAKQRKERKAAKKDPQWRSRLKKDPGIPNLFPFKDKILAEVEETRRRKEEDVLRRREIARAQREGGKVDGQVVVDDDEDEELVDPEDEEDEEDEDEDMAGGLDEANPMAALLASAQARAHTFSRDDDDNDDPNDIADEWQGLPPAPHTLKQNPSTTTPKNPQSGSTPRILPSQAISDPIKTVTLLLARLQKTQSGLQQVLDYYNIPPLMTAGSDVTTRLLVDVARKRGRLGRGGVPNLHAAALLLLGDVQEERLRFTDDVVGVLQSRKGAVTTAAAATTTTVSGKGPAKSEVQIVQTMAEPFRIEGLFGDGAA